MKKHICIIAGLCAAFLALTACSDDFLEVKNPTGEPLEEYYTTEETLNEALTQPTLLCTGPTGTVPPTTTSPLTARSWATTSG